MHRLDLINANKAAKISDSKSLTLKFKVKHFGRFILVIRSESTNTIRLCLGPILHQLARGAEDNGGMANCACGCGSDTAGGTFLPGHDQRLRSDLEKRAGGLLRLSTLVDLVEQYVGGHLAEADFAARVSGLFRPNA